MTSSFFENLWVQCEKSKVHEEGGRIVASGAFEIEEVFNNFTCGKTREFGHLGDSVTTREDLGNGFGMLLAGVHGHARGGVMATLASRLRRRLVGLYHG